MYFLYNFLRFFNKEFISNTSVSDSGIITAILLPSSSTSLPNLKTSYLNLGNSSFNVLEDLAKVLNLVTGLPTVFEITESFNLEAWNPIFFSSTNPSSENFCIFLLASFVTACPNLVSPPPIPEPKIPPTSAEPPIS